MLTSDYAYKYPEELIAKQPTKDFRILLNQNNENFEISKQQLFDTIFKPGDLLVLNDTRVEKRRVFSEEGLEVLFVEAVSPTQWKVLFPSSRMKTETLNLPNSLSMRLIEKGLPQTVEISFPIDDSYFDSYGEMALPPYIQKARGERHQQQDDNLEYQTSWAVNSGSCAAPTASLHFNNKDIENLRSKGINISYLTLHVGLGTFLPIKAKNLMHHQMHKEEVQINSSVISQIEQTKLNNKKVWALGTTVTRSLESFAQNKLTKCNWGYKGATDLFIYPGFEFKIVDGLLTNFHQPESTLLALVAAFSSRDNVMKAYEWAINNRFRLFSYGDLSVWLK